MVLDPDRKFKKYIFSVILYNYDYPRTNKIDINLFTPEKTMKHIPGLWIRDFSQGKAMLSWAMMKKPIFQKWSG